METGQLVFTKSIAAYSQNGEQRLTVTWKPPKGQLMVFAALGTTTAEKMGNININKVLKGWGWTSPDDMDEIAADRNARIRELDVLLNGEAGAAQQAALIDIIAQVKREGIKSTQRPIHPDDRAIDRFAAAMKARMAEMRAKGKSGWDDPEVCSVDYLARLLQASCVSEPVDVGNYAMMLFNRGGK